MKPELYFIFLLLTLMQFLQHIQAFIVNVDAHNEECFFEKIETGTKFSKK